MDEFRIRPATNADGPVVTDLVSTALNEFGISLDPGNTDADLRDLEGHYSARGGMFDVLEDVGGVVRGCVGLYRMDRTVCELRKMYLERGVRGRGLGRRLLEHALGRARDLGFERVTLETAAVLKDAARLYVRNGFRPYQAEHLSRRCDTAYYLDLLHPGIG